MSIINLTPGNLGLRGEIMARTGIYFVIKFIIMFISAVVSFVLIVGNAWFWVLLVVFFITAINYLLMDLLILPRYGNALTSFGNGAIGALLAYAGAFFVPAFQVTFTALLIFAVLVAVGEFFYRQYLLLNRAVHNE